MVSLTRITAFTLAALLTGCSFVNATSSHMGGSSVDAGTDDRDAGSPSPDAGRIGPPRVRVVHVARDTGSVDVLARVGSDATPLAQGLDFATAATRVDLPEGTFTFEVVRRDAPGDTIVSESLGPLEANTDYTLAFFGDEMDPPFEARGTGVLLLEDDADGLDPRVDIRLSVIHLASSVSAGQLVAIDMGGAFSPLGDAVDFRGVVPLRALRAMSYTVGFDAGADDTLDVRFQLPDYRPGTYCDVFIASRGDGTVFLLSISGSGSVQIIDAL